MAESTDTYYTPDGQYEDIRPLNGGEIYSTAPGLTKPFTGTAGLAGASAIDNGRAGGKGMNAAQTQIAGDAIGAVASVASTGIQAYFQNKEINAARKEARSLEDQARNDALSQAGVSNSLKRKSLKQAEEQMKLDQKRDEYDLRFNRWILSMKKALDARQKLAEGADNVFNSLSDERVIQAIRSQFA